MSHVMTYNILLYLQVILGDNDRSARQATLKTIMNTRISNETPIKDHMVRMVRLFNKMEILRIKIDEDIRNPWITVFPTRNCSKCMLLVLRLFRSNPIGK